MGKKAVLITIENNRRITGETDRDFLFEFQRAVLLAMKESKELTEMQYRYAQEKLKAQYHTIMKSGNSVEKRGGEEA